MQTLNFTISEFNISGEDIPQYVADKILHFHILPMQDVRNELGYWMTASLHSGYRSPAWEKKHKRKGTSQHCFIHLGAVDWTCKDFKNNKEAFLKAIIKHTSYTRMAVYKGFIHCDYKETDSGQREIHDSDSKSIWTLREIINN